jgi:hypothetical protein
MAEKSFSQDPTIYGDIVGDLVGNVIGNVTGNLTGDVTGNLTGDVNAATVTTTDVYATNLSGDLLGNVVGTADFATTALGLDYTSSTLTVPTVTWNTGSTTINSGTSFTRSIVIPLDATYGICFINFQIEFSAVSAPTVPFDIELNSLNAAEDSALEIGSFNGAGSNSRPLKGLIASGGDTISIPGAYGLTVIAGHFFAANFSYKCVL